LKSIVLVVLAVRMSFDLSGKFYIFRYW